ncbi:MAG TPA: glycosyltransferase family 39 protein [Actinomycetota bacterium]
MEDVPSTEPEAAAPVSRSRVPAMLALATLAGLMVRAVLLDRQSFWMDEALEYFIVTIDSPVEMVRRIADGLDKNPPLYHLVMWLWVRVVPDTEAWLRAPSVLASTAMIPAAWAIARRLAPKAALGAAIIVAVSPFAIYYGQEARMYAFAGALGAWSVAAFLWALDAPGRKGRWVVYAILRLLAAYTHPYALLLGVPELVVALRRAKARRPFLASAVAQGVLYAPWLIVLLRLSSAGAGFAESTSPLAIGYTFFSFLFGFSLGPSLAELHGDVDLGAHAAVIALAALALAGPAIVWVRRGSARGLIASYVGALVGGALLVTALTPVAFNVRYVIAAMPLVAIAIADGLLAWRWRIARVLAAFTVGGLMAVSLWNWWNDPAYAKDDHRSAVAYVMEGHRAGDRVLLLTYQDPFRYYTDDAVPFRTLYKDGALDEAAWDALQTDGLDPGRLWVLRARPWEIDPDAEILEWILDHGELIGGIAFPGVEVFELSVPA